MYLKLLLLAHFCFKVNFISNRSVLKSKNLKTIKQIGDPKDSVRNGVRSLFKQIGYVYTVSRLFMYIMEGLKSKNARQRAECLEVMGSLIEDYGLSICLPSAASCLKEIAKQISDRDNAVRSAALNCVVQAYYIVGEKVFKMVGQVSEIFL